MTINIVEFSCPFDNVSEFEVTFFDDSIHTLLTHTPSMVDYWIANIEDLHRHSLNNLIVGLDVEWRPSFDPSHEYPAAILQLCDGSNCLIFPLLRAPSIPPSLVNFLANPNYSFVGVGIDRDVEKLLVYGLQVSRTVDLRGLAARVFNSRVFMTAGLKTLARDVLGKDVEKPRAVTLSRWDSEFLTHDQIQYACIDAFLSFEIGRILISRN